MNIGVLGGGQLGRMLALAAYPLGLRLRCYDSAADAPAGHLAPLTVGRFDDLDALGRFADGLDVVTYEFENVPAAAAKWLAKRVPVYPPPAALEASQDRHSERTLFEGLGIPAPQSAAVNTAAEARTVVERVGGSAGGRTILKTRRMGYDGKGQAVVRSAGEVDAAWESISRTAGAGGVLVDEFVPFEREVSVLAARSRLGEVRVYPLVENVHTSGILRQSIAPAPDSEGLQAVAESHARSVLTSLNYVGVIALEFFQVRRDGRPELLLNEMAPRVHNSGHWTIEGAVCSQFENHLRAVAGLPLGDPAAIGHCAMLNLIGTLPDSSKVLAVDGARLHLYGKEPRAGRKVGHVTMVAKTGAELKAAMARLAEALS